FESLVQAARLKMAGSADSQGVSASSEIEALKADLIRCYKHKRVELSTLSPAFVTEVSERPTASPLARLQAQTGDTVTSLRHEAGQLNEFGRVVLSLLDENHDHQAIVAKLIHAVETGRVTFKRMDPKTASVPSDRTDALHDAVAEKVDDVLKKLARFALLVA